MEFVIAYTNYMLAFVDKTLTNELRIEFANLLSEQEDYVKRNVFKEIFNVIYAETLTGALSIDDAINQLYTEQNALDISKQIEFGKWGNFFRICINEILFGKDYKESIAVILDAADEGDEAIRYGTGHIILEFLVSTNQVVAEKKTAKRIMAMIEGFDPGNKPPRYALIRELVSAVVSNLKRSK